MRFLSLQCPRGCAWWVYNDCPAHGDSVPSCPARLGPSRAFPAAYSLAAPTRTPRVDCSRTGGGRGRHDRLEAVHAVGGHHAGGGVRHCGAAWGRRRRRPHGGGRRPAVLPAVCDAVPARLGGDALPRDHHHAQVGDVGGQALLRPCEKGWQARVAGISAGAWWRGAAWLCDWLCGCTRAGLGWPWRACLR